MRKRDGSTLSYTYDNLNRITVKLVPERAGLTAAQTRDVYYGYDLRNLQLFARFDSVSGPGIANQYDGFGRLTSTTANTDGVARTLAYQYDRDGSRTAIAHPDGNGFAIVRDGLDRPYWLSSSDNIACYYSSYRPDGLPGSQSRCNGSATWVSRDALGRLNGLGHYYGTGGTGDATWLYDFNPASQIRTVNRDNDTYAWTGHYAVNRGYTTNGLNQYTAAGSATFGYDANGNLTADGATAFTYDVENRLVAASGAHNAVLAYDPLGRLTQITAGTGAITRFLYDGDDLIAEYDGSGAMTHRYVHWDGADVPVIAYDGPTLASPRYLHADHQGSIVAISSASGVGQINRYDEYGIPAATNAGRFQYTGQIWIDELGLYYYKSRAYSPTLGRFMQTDPVGYEDQFNLYEYVGDDPVNATDPTGETCDNPNSGRCGQGVGLSARATHVGIRSERVRNEYNRRVNALDPNDSAGRSAVKAEARAATPPEVRAVVENRRPGLGPRPGSIGRAHVPNAGADGVARSLGRLGRGAGVIGVVVAVADIATSDNPGRATVANVMGAIGGLAGGAGGAAAGSLGGPAAPVTVPAGAVGGSIAGGHIGYRLGERVYDFLAGN